MSTNAELGLEQLKAIADASDGKLEVLQSQGTDDGTLFVDISVDTSGIVLTTSGMPLRARERFVVEIPRGFPFKTPDFYTRHTRFLGFPHVYWGHYLCLFQAPETEWNPADGMFGFVDRVELFLQKAAAGELDPVGAPMHPPTTRTSTKRSVPTVIPRTNTPAVRDEPWFGLASIENISKVRIDITGWVNILNDDWPEGPVAAAVLLSAPLSHEFPATVGELIRALQANSIDRRMLILIIRCALVQAEPDAPLLLLVGAPMRGITGESRPKQHLTAWWIDKDLANTLRLIAPKGTDSNELRTLRGELEAKFFAILEDQPVTWCTVLEDRPEILMRRDVGTPTSWFHGKRVVLWGCGALGSQIAEGVVRAGAASLVLYDNAQVKPGVLVRQPFEDLDIGQFKAQVLATRLQRIRPDLNVAPNIANVLTAVLDREDWDDQADIVIDATASRAVLAKTEWTRRKHYRRVPLASMVIGPTAQTCMLLLAGQGHSGGPLEVSREAKLALLGGQNGAHHLEDFFPLQTSRPFQPEPGCSEPTFVGSYADVASLSHLMLNATAEIVQSLAASESGAWFFGPAKPGQRAGPQYYRFDGRLTSYDVTSGFEVRISSNAWFGMQTVVEESAWRHGRRVETGGILLGQRDETLKIIWIDEFTPPPPDSVLTKDLFVCGTQGTAELHASRVLSSQGSVRYVGMWHTHPQSLPVPSATDIGAMHTLSLNTGSASSHTLMVIVGTPFTNLSLATYAFSAAEVHTGQFRRTCVVSHPPSRLRESARRRGLMRRGS